MFEVLLHTIIELIYQLEVMLSKFFHLPLQLFFISISHPQACSQKNILWLSLIFGIFFIRLQTFITGAGSFGGGFEHNS